MTRILALSDAALDEAAAVIREGGLVAFPTETVYGLGADATDGTAVARIFEAKKRPSFNPLIVHFPDREEAWNCVSPTAAAETLANAFWPGALTMVLPRREDSSLSPLVSAGLPSAAVRVPGHGWAQKLLACSMRPIAAPSANRSGAISPTTAAHVADSLGSAVDLILDGGPCPVGLESTIIDLTLEAPTILRHGGVTEEAVAAALGIPFPLPTPQRAPADGGLKSPGLMRSHYAPHAVVRLNATHAGPGEVFLGFGPDSAGATLNLSPSGNLREAAANLFSYLHKLDEGRPNGIAVAAIPQAGLGKAINDRLNRAAAPRI